MKTLLEMYSVTEILIFVVVLALAIKEVISFFDWASERLNKIFDKENKQKTDKQEIELQLREDKEALKELKQHQKETWEAISAMSKKVDMLIDSDKDDIKSYLTREHHYFCYQQGWIDDYSLECCEKRFSHYQEEGGNSFIEGFMNELRQLPKQKIEEKDS